MSHQITCGDAPIIACGQTWPSQLLPVSTVPNTGRSLSTTRRRIINKVIKVSFTVLTLILNKNPQVSIYRHERELAAGFLDSNCKNGIVCFRYKPSTAAVSTDDPTPDYMNLLGMIFSMCGLMMKVCDT